MRLGQLFPADAEGIDRFLVAITGVYRDLYADVEQTGGIPQPPTTPAAIAAWPTLRPDANRWMQRGYVEMLDAFIVDPRPKRMLTTIAEYVTDQPDRLTVGEMAPLFGYYLEGGSYPVGGSQKLADLLSSVIEGHGGRVQLATTVDRILIVDGVVKGIGTADGGVHWAPVVVGNGDVRAMLTELIPPATLPRRYQQRIASRRPGPSAILVSLGLDIVPDLPTRVFLAIGDLQFGIGNPSLIDPSLAPPGCAALTLMSLVSEEQAADWFHLDRRAYHVAKTEYVKRLLAAVDLIVPGIERHSRYRQIGSSRTFARYLRTSAGGIYGGPRRQWKPAMKSPIPGLLLVGGGTRTGPGIEAVVISGIAAANAIAAGQPASLV